MYKAFIFDLDGTICDTIHTIAHYGNIALSQFGFDAIDTKEYNYFAGNGADVLIKRMLKFHGIENDALSTEMLSFYKTEYEKDSLYKTKAFDGIKEVIKELKARNIKTAVVSNKPHGAVCDVVEALFDKGDFDFYMGIQDGVIKKPAPDSVLSVADRFNIVPEKCVYVGDTSVDMQTGKNANMYTVGVLWGFRDYDELIKNGADLIIEKPYQLLDIIK